jgi:hypothetical protein
MQIDLLQELGMAFVQDSWIELLAWQQ